MTDDQIRIGVVGVQGIGMAHLFALGSIEGAEATAVCDIDAAAVAKTAEDFGCKPFERAEELFTSGAVDAVVLAVPPHLHANLAYSALDAGLHVYLEKPMVPVAADGDELAAAAESSGQVMAVGYQHRFQASYERARQILDEGGIGTVFRTNMTSTKWFRPHVYFDATPWRTRWETVGGGVLLTQATHTLDAFVWLGGMPSRVTAQAWRSLHRSQVEGEVSALLEYPDGARGTLVASTVDPVGRNRVELHGTAGTLVADGHALERLSIPAPVDELLQRSESFEEVDVEAETLVPAPESEQMAVFELIQASLRDFVTAVRDGGRPRNNPREANRAVELANAVYLAAVTREPVTLPLDHDAYRDVYRGLCDGSIEIPLVPGARP